MDVTIPSAGSPQQDVGYKHEDKEDQSEVGDETANGIDTSMVDDEADDGGPNGTYVGQRYAVPDEPTDYSLFSNPPNLGIMRQRLFDVEAPIQLSPADFNAYFPFMDNVWRREKKDTQRAENGTTTDIYWCRLRKSAHSKIHGSKAVPEEKRQRRKKAREDISCDMTMKVIYSGGAIPTCSVVPGQEKAKHTHDLDYLDSLKRNTGIMDTARREGQKGFLASSTHHKMFSEPDKMKDAGGLHMKVSDCRNVQIAWREANRNVLFKVHTGYIQTRKGRTAGVTVAKSKPQPIPPTQVPTQRVQIPLSTLQYPELARTFLEKYLPEPHAKTSHMSSPHVTLTYASSLDGRISLMSGIQTAISGPETRAMTHYLRSRHDAILIGVRTAIADDPSLNCRLAGAGGYGGAGLLHQPRPIIIDPHARLIVRPDMKILRVVSEGRAKAPWIVVAPNAQLHPQAVATLKSHGGEYLMINDYQPNGPGMNWEGIFGVLFKEGIRSVMVEGGGIVLSELLRPRYAHLLHSVIITIAPTFMGKAGTVVSPDSSVDEQGKPLAARLKDVLWQPMGEEDVVMCGRIKREENHSDTNGILQGIEQFSQGGQPPLKGPAAGNSSVSTTQDPPPRSGPPKGVFFS